MPSENLVQEKVLAAPAEGDSLNQREGSVPSVPSDLPLIEQIRSCFRPYGLGWKAGFHGFSVAFAIGKSVCYFISMVACMASDPMQDYAVPAFPEDFQFGVLNENCITGCGRQCFNCCLAVRMDVDQVMSADEFGNPSDCLSDGNDFCLENQGVI